MGALDERLMAELKDAMRAGDTTRRDVIRFLRAAFKNAQIARIAFDEEQAEAGVPVERAPERDQPLSDEEELRVLQRQIKQRQDAIELYEKAGRADLVAREGGQLAILQGYLPQGLDQGEIDALVRAVIAETGAQGAKDMKLVMPALIARAAGRADSRALGEAARRLLAAT